jgi:hypothetical protein
LTLWVKLSKKEIRAGIPRKDSILGGRRVDPISA